MKASVAGLERGRSEVRERSLLGQIWQGQVGRSKKLEFYSHVSEENDLDLNYSNLLHEIIPTSKLSCWTTYLILEVRVELEKSIKTQCVLYLLQRWFWMLTENRLQEVMDDNWGLFWLLKEREWWPERWMGMEWLKMWYYSSFPKFCPNWPLSVWYFLQ
jgi:hypothetical protein